MISLPECTALMVEKGLPAIEAEKFINFYASKGWMVGKTKMKSVPHAVAGWALRYRQSERDAAQIHTNRNFWLLTKQIEFLESEATALKNRHCSIGALDHHWDSKEARDEFRSIRAKIVELRKRLINV